MSLTLVASNVFKSYNGKPVLKDCSFSFDKTGTYVLMGPNGCGKSTFFRICTLLEDPDRGEVNFYSDGTPLEKDIKLKRQITLLLPAIGVFNTTVYKNVAYGLRIRGQTRSEIEGRVGKALDFVGILDKKNQKARTLSSGETKRLGIARALVIEPEIIFFDEPTASVDPKNTEIIEEIILRMKKQTRSTVIITTHDMSQAERIGDSILTMQDGGIVERSR